jgi:ABC-type phosphate/phosphonate transport system substrate-binding protein
MRTYIVTLLTAALLAAGPARGDAKRTGRPALKVGAVASGPSSVSVFRALRLHFARNKMPVEFVLYSTYDGLNDALLNRQVDVAWNSPLGHARFHIKAGDSQTLVMRDVDVDYRVKLIVRKDAGITGLDDLPGKKMLFGSCDSADATVLPAYYLARAGVDFRKVKVVSLHGEVDELGCPCHSEHHVLAALRKGRGQTGILGAALWQRFQAEQPREAARFKVVWTSPPFSHCVFTARKDFSSDTAARFVKVMLAMDGKDSATREVLKLEGCTKWVPAGKKAREGFADLLEALRQKSPLP